MRILTLVLGIVGGFLGLFCSAGILTVCPGSGVGADCARDLIERGCTAFLLSIAAIIGWVLTVAGLKLGGRLMLIAGVLGSIAAFPIYLVPGALLIVGGLLALTAGQPYQGPGQAQPEGS